VRRWGRDVDAAYLLVVRVTDDDVMHGFTARRDGGAATPRRIVARSTGRRLGLRLALVRLRDSETVWVGSGTGELWETRTAGMNNGRLLTPEDDLRDADLSLYPPPPHPANVSVRLTRGLLARVPWPVEIQPN